MLSFQSIVTGIQVPINNHLAKRVPPETCNNLYFKAINYKGHLNQNQLLHYSVKIIFVGLFLSTLSRNYLCLPTKKNKILCHCLSLVLCSNRYLSRFFFKWCTHETYKKHYSVSFFGSKNKTTNRSSCNILNALSNPFRYMPVQCRVQNLLQRCELGLNSILLPKPNRLDYSFWFQFTFRNVRYFGNYKKRAININP